MTLVLDRSLGRMSEVIWVLDYLEDIDSDMSAFHRVDDYGSMPAPRFFARAARLPAYQGALRETFRQEAAGPRPTGQAQQNGHAQMDVRQQAVLAPDWIEMARG